MVSLITSLSSINNKPTVTESRDLSPCEALKMPLLLAIHEYMKPRECVRNHLVCRKWTQLFQRDVKLEFGQMFNKFIYLQVGTHYPAIDDQTLQKITSTTFLKKAESVELQLHGPCQITDQGLEHLSHAPIALRSLSLVALPHISDKGIEHLSKLALKSLDIVPSIDTGHPSLMRITSKSIESIAALSLEQLNIQLLDISDQDFQNIAKISTLTNLSIASLCPSSGIGLDRLSPLPIKTLYLHNIRILPIEMWNLHNLPLDNLTFYRCPIHIPEIVMKCVSKIPLKELYLLASGHIDDRSLKCITNSSLQRVFLASEPFISYEGVKNLVNRLALKTLDIRLCSSITLDDALSIHKDHPSMELNYFPIVRLGITH